jgi:hypothetical protein
MEAKHTPGPWKAVDCRHQFNGQIRIWKDALPTEPMIANVLAKNPNAEANARLIAAAPELLEALEKIRNLERRNFREAWDMLQEVDRLAGAAIRKAKGE